MRVRIVVADRGEARFYDVASLRAPLKLAGRLSDSTARLHDRDLTTDRPGRVFDHAPPPTGRRGAVAHHGAGDEPGPREHEAERFARQIAERLEAARQGFDRVVLMAEPGFLGTLRIALSKGVAASVAAEVPKDLVHQDDDAVRAHLTREMFRMEAE
jgi:protein required for attachment to host cells